MRAAAQPIDSSGNPRRAVLFLSAIVIIATALVTGHRTPPDPRSSPV